MANLKGVSFLAYEGSSPTIVSGGRGATVSISHAPADASSKDSDWKTTLEGVREWSWSADGVFVVDDTGLAATRTAIEAGSSLTMKIRDTENHDEYTGTAIVTSFEKSGSNGDVVTYSVAFQGSGALAFSTY
jgi:TP901-1 family phage major tail protein